MLYSGKYITIGFVVVIQTVSVSVVVILIRTESFVSSKIHLMNVREERQSRDRTISLITTQHSPNNVYSVVVTD